jgi:AcrR family transcriptional regulator
MAIAKATTSGPTGRTAERILLAALDAFGTRGYGATSLDDLAGELGIRKQTILYWYPSKEVLLDAAIDRTAAEVTVRLERAVLRAGPGFGRVEAIVRAMFRLAARHPTMIGFLREVTRLGPPASSRLLAALTPLVDRAAGFLAADPARRVLDGHRPGDRGRGAAHVRRGADARLAGEAARRACGAAARRAGPRGGAGRGDRVVTGAGLSAHAPDVRPWPDRSDGAHARRRE